MIKDHVRSVSGDLFRDRGSRMDRLSHSEFVDAAILELVIFTSPRDADSSILTMEAKRGRVRGTTLTGIRGRLQRLESKNGDESGCKERIHEGA